jgi:protein-tyrosine-phosphatase
MQKIHFVCTGNIYRSRLAETYLKSKQLNNIKVSSSGIRAGVAEQVTISWYALHLIEQNNLLTFVSPTYQLTTESLLSDADMIIFMTKYHYDYCVENLNFRSNNFEIWNIEDMTPEILSAGKEPAIVEATKTFELIKTKVDTLIDKLEKSYV